MNNQCVPSWDLDNNNNNPSTIHNKLILDNYEVAKLTWKGGLIDMHGFDQPRSVPVNPFPPTATKYTWEKTRASGTLESIVDRAIIVPKIKLPTINLNNEKFVSLFEHHRNADDSACGGGDLGRDALVPSSNESCNEQTISVSSSYGGTQESSSRSSLDVTVDTWDTYLDVNSALEEPQGNTSYGNSSCNDITSTDDQYGSVCPSRRQKNKTKKSRRYSVSNRRSRAAAIHNQSERKRRDRINQRMKTLQKMVPNSNKIDKASILDEVIEYLKQLQAQVNMMKMNMSPMMLPMIMQQKQLQMSMMMASMGIGRHNNMNGILPVFYPTPFMPMSSWGGSGDRLAVPMIDPLSAFAACQSQPIMEAYSRMAALFQ